MPTARNGRSTSPAPGVASRFGLSSRVRSPRRPTPDRTRAVGVDRWLDAERKPLLTIAAYGPERLGDPAAVGEDLAAAAAPRRHSVDVG